MGAPAASASSRSRAAQNGGVLNRVDSLLMAFPLSYYAVILVGKVTH